MRTGALRADSTTAERLEELKGQLVANFGVDALDGDGNLAAAFHTTPLGRQYLELRSAASHAIGGGDQRAIVFNHLYQFFSHYYDSGDFLSLRRYSARQKYAIPYNGEEVHLHWANADQYYIKTSEYFTDYRWKAPGAMGDAGVTVLFKLRNAEQEAGNNKANEKRYFCFSPDDLDYDAETQTLTLPSAYRALDKKEQKSVSGNGDRPQQMLNDAALDGVRSHKILAQNPSLKAAILAPARNAAGQVMVDSQTKEPVPLLLKHLRSYAKRNNSDFFIHKDLAGFLTRELDFYLKNEVLSLDTLLAGGPRPSEGWFQLLHVIKTLGCDIIAFLAQLENFQKSLFEKKKFITDCHWCLTLDRVSSSLLPEVAANPQQWEQWEDLHKISTIESKTKAWAKGKDPEKALTWLKSMPFLMVDTSLFMESDFQDRLLSTLPDIDAQMDGLLVDSENFQGLSLVSERYRASVKCLYIDPPYNTGGDDFLYKDSYQHSSWLSLIRDRLEIGRYLLNDSGGGACNLNDIEDWRFRGLLDSCFGEQSYVTTIVTKCSTASSFRTVNTGPVDISDRIILFSKDKSTYSFTPQPVTKCVDLQHFSRYIVNLNEAPEKWRFRSIKLEVMNKLGLKCENTVEGKKLAKAKWGEAADIIIQQQSEIFAVNNADAVFETKTLQKPSKWLLKVIADSKSNTEKIYIAERDGNPPIILLGGRQFYFLGQSIKIINGEKRVTEPASTLWMDIDTNNLRHEGDVEFPAGKKPIKLIQRIVNMNGSRGEIAALDFFAGSGSTGHAVINLNREDSGNRKYILMEMGAYFDDVLKRRMQKVVFSRDWKEGAPVPQKKPADPKNPYHGLSHAFKVIRLESYEDALANIEFTHTAEGELFTRQVGEEYLLKYALEFETQGSATRLRPEALTSPFDYRLNLFDGTETKTKPVDLPETFHYLIGLKVATRRWLERKVGKITHRYLHVTGTANGDGKQVAVLWRNVPSNWKEADYQAEKAWAREMQLFDGADRGWYNGPGTLLDAQPLDSEFRRLLFA
ncbi:MAG: site-specific DNA-methyltransferase [Verrucomicrobiota bacterium]